MALIRRAGSSAAGMVRAQRPSTILAVSSTLSVGGLVPMHVERGLPCMEHGAAGGARLISTGCCA